MDKLPEKSDENEKLINSLALKQIMEELTEQERIIIELRYFQEKTQTEVAKTLSVSQVQISRIEKRILLKMREKMAG